MKKLKIALLSGLSAGLIASTPAWAGAKLKIDDEAYIDLGFRVQALTMMMDQDLDGDGLWEDETDFRVRRARFRLKGVVNKYVTAFIQTEAADDVGGSGSDARVIDSWVNVKYDNWIQLFAGQHMAPSSRQATTSSGALLTIDRPGNNTKNLTWGARSLKQFSTATYGDSNDPAISGRNAVRDVGMTFFGSGSLSDDVHVKYYAGLYDGVQNASTGEDNLRFTTRAQFNFFDAEPGYFNLSSYLGKKQTMGFGFSYDSQDDVQDVVNVNGNGNYEYWSVDAFADWPMGSGTFTAEAAFSDLDLGSATVYSEQSQGNGWYVQAGYLVNQWQPWVEFESWDGDAASGLGDYDSFRVGITYYLKGHSANLKLGFESFKGDRNFTGTAEDTTNTLVFGVYTTY